MEVAVSVLKKNLLGSPMEVLQQPEEVSRG
jgi:hypothetical protein